MKIWKKSHEKQSPSLLRIITLIVHILQTGNLPNLDTLATKKLGRQTESFYFSSVQHVTLQKINRKKNKHLKGDRER